MGELKLSQLTILVIVGLLFARCEPPAVKGNLINSIDEFNTAVANASPGDKIILGNGEWQDAELLFEADGTEDAPITLTVEEKGKVILTGKSNLRIAGKFLIVEGLIFKNGYSPTNEVISFKKDNAHLAYNSRVTECVIDNYNNPERFESETWVALYGQHNRFDHNYLVDKRNRGVTVIVRLNSEESINNYHRIDHNHFGARQNLGANGGETLRIGTSHHSMSPSYTMVENNFFDRCDGEHEIISSKSCHNTYRNNTFFECRGTLTYRHGNDNLAEGNVFIGNRKPHTGGIRIINERNKAINNHFQDLTGYRFRGALVIMNGVPNSPLNRYFQVDGGEASNNTFINCDHIQLCAGSDEERSAVPINTSVKNNLILHQSRSDIFTVYDDIDGIQFEKNQLSTNLEPLQNQGFNSISLDIDENEEGLLLPRNNEGNVGSKIRKIPALSDNTGVNWYPKRDIVLKLNTGRTLKVKPGINTLYEAINRSQSGDIIELSTTGDYLQTKSIHINHPITIRADAALREKPIIKTEKKSLFNIENGGALSLIGLKFDGSTSPDGPGNAIIRTSKYSMNHNYKLFITTCDFENLAINHSFDAIKVYKETFADSIVIKNSRFENVSGSVLALNKETEDIGIYNAEHVVLENSLFSKIQGMVVDLYRGGGDESTFGPYLNINHCVLNEVGHGKRNQKGASIALHGVQIASIKNSIIQNSKPLDLFLTVGEPIISVKHNNLFNSERIKTNSDEFEQSDNTNINPEFNDHFTLPDDSPLKGKGSDGKDLGLYFTTKIYE